MADTQFQSLAKLVAEKLNEIIVKVNTHNSNKAEVSGQTFTGDVVTPNLSVSNTITTDDITISGDITSTGIVSGSTETESLFINGSNVIVKRQLGSLAFSSDTIPTDVSDLNDANNLLTQEYDTLSDITGRGATTSDEITVGGVTSDNLIVKDNQGSTALTVSGSTIDSVSKLIIDSDSTNSFEVLNNGTSIILASTSGVTFNNSFTLPSSDGTNGQVLTTNGSGGVIWKSIDSSSSDFAEYILTYTFTGDGSTTDYTVNATTLNKILYVELNGLIQKETDNYSVSGKTITFDEAPDNGVGGTIVFWGNDVTSAVQTKAFSGNGSTTTYTVDTELGAIVLVEVNGLIQRQGTDYTVSLANDSITFTNAVPTNSTGVIVYV